MHHCGLESKVRAMKYHKGCHSWVLPGFHWAPYPFLIHLILHHLPLFLCHTWKQCQSLQLPLALSSVATIKDVTNPVAILNYASSATNSTNYTRKSVPSLSGLCPCGPSGSQGPTASSWHGLGNWDSWDPWPPGLQQPTHHHQQPIKTRSFPPQTPVPSHHSNCCFILGHKTELF